ncbi:MAG TPA: ComEA family DNA-binding protein [Actinomycetota bacterium]|nr:ComEA family DNA-binding protein [Actinomycetota bacterium]
MDDIVIRGGVRARLEEIVGRRIDTGVVVALVAVLVVGGLLVWGRRPAAAIAPPATAASAPAAPAASPPGAQLYVHVAGAVRRPGLYALPPGGRVADAIEAAGGALGRADLDLLNLAAPLADGTKVDVLVRGAEPAQGVPAGVAAPAAVSLNAAGVAELETIPGIGPVTAAAIVAYRDEAGPFTSVEQLMEVSGIGPATLESIRPYVSL